MGRPKCPGQRWNRVGGHLLASAYVPLSITTGFRGRPGQEQHGGHGEEAHLGGAGISDFACLLVSLLVVG